MLSDAKPAFQGCLEQASCAYLAATSSGESANLAQLLIELVGAWIDAPVEALTYWRQWTSTPELITMVASYIRLLTERMVTYIDEIDSAWKWGDRLSDHLHLAMLLAELPEGRRHLTITPLLDLCMQVAGGGGKPAPASLAFCLCVTHHQPKLRAQLYSHFCKALALRLQGSSKSRFFTVADKFLSKPSIGLGTWRCQRCVQELVDYSEGLVPEGLHNAHQGAGQLLDCRASHQDGTALGTFEGLCKSDEEDASVGGWRVGERAWIGLPDVAGAHLAQAREPTPAVAVQTLHLKQQHVRPLKQQRQSRNQQGRVECSSARSGVRDTAS